MTDSKISSSSPSSGVSSATGGSGGKTGGAPAAGNAVTARPSVQDALVQQSPANILLSGNTTELQGTVLSSNPARGQIDISTPKGELIISSDKDIPAGTDVSIRLISRRNELLATLTILKRSDATEKAAQDSFSPSKTPAQPLKAGDTVTAIRITTPQEDATAQQGSAAASQADNTTRPTLAQVGDTLQSLQSLTVADFAKLPGPPPLPAQTLYQVLQSPDIQAALQQLPPEQQQALLDYAARPDVQQALQKITQPVTQPSSPYFPAVSTPVQAPQASTDADIVNIIRTQLGMFMPQTGASGTAATAPRNALSGLASLLPLLQTLERSSAQTGGALLSGLPPETAADATGGLLPQNLNSITILSITPPDGAATENVPVPAGVQTLTGTVESLTPAGFPVIQTTDGQDFVLKTQANVAVGSKIVFTVSRLDAQEALARFGTTASTGAGTVGAGGSFNPLIDSRWPALNETLQALAATAPEAAQLLQNTIPATAAGRFAPTTLLFLAALRMDSVQNWLGENALQTLRQNGRQTLADRLAGDFSKIADQTRAPLPGGWRAISLPLMHDGDITQAQFFWRRQEDAGDDENGMPRKPMTRFVLNLHLSRLGDMQLDGLLRQKRLDMILRGERMLPASIRRELMQAYAQAMGQTGMEGTIGFQARAEQWVTMELPHVRGLSA